MKVAFVALGSRGDVQPFVAIAKELIRRGTPSVILAQGLFRPWIESEGIQFVNLPGNFTKDMSESLVAKAIITGNMKILMEDFYNKERVGQTVLQVLRYLKNDKEVTLVACGPAFTFLAPMMYQISGVPFCGIHLFLDLVPSSQIPCQLFPVILPFGLSIRLFQMLAHFALHGPLIKYVKELDFSDICDFDATKAVFKPQLSLPHYFACSYNITPRPTDWPDDILVGGSVFYENRLGSNALSSKTAAFLQHGNAPVYVGFGSLPADLCTDYPAFIDELVDHSDPTMRFIVFARNMDNSQVTNASGEMLQKKWENSKRVLVVASEPHNILFPQCSVIVHHGGAGTTAEAARSGKPAVICSFCCDQLIWAAYIAKANAGINAGSFCRLTGKQLAVLIKNAEEPKMMAVAKELGVRIREERGLENACDWLMALAGGNFSLRKELTWLEWFWGLLLALFGIQFIPQLSKKMN
ncbi:hypothetical protein HDU79_008566 [Rhizoclosmatium sp. JEL0117]|nr:hypothetical protein HDU79_008566 [Rhizoclosmatium sp. JEL0117]